MKNFIIKVIIFLFFPILLVISINYMFDPANLFDAGHSYEKEIVSYLQKGYNVTNTGNMDERMLQKFFIEGLTNKPEIVIFGSSNSLYIDSDFFPKQNLINNAVSAATLNDFLAIYDLYEKKGYKPDTVVLGICPEMLKNVENDFWTSLEDNYNEMLYKIGLESNQQTKTSFHQRIKKYLEIISLRYFQSSVERALDNSSIKPTRNKYNEGTTRVTDGSYNDGTYYTKKTQQDIDNTVKRLIGKPFVHLEEFSEISEERKQVLEHFVEYLLQKDIHAVFYQLVYHPLIYENFDEKYEILKKLEIYLNDYASKKGITLIGQNNPYKCNVTNVDFNDVTHLNKKGLLKIFHSPIDLNKQ